MTLLGSFGKNSMNVMRYMEFYSLNCRYSKVAFGKTQEH